MDPSVSFLNGYTALDLTDLRGQLCGRLLGDLGMEVIKVEPPGGDPVRFLGPFKSSQDGSRLSLPFIHLNANKKSLIIDIRDPAGREKFLRLAERSHVVVESFAAGFLDSIGLGYRDLAKVNPRLIVASISGFGQTGPRSKFAVADIVAFAMSGLMHISGDPSLPPCKPPESQAYYFGSLFGTLGIVAALYRRERSGKGDHVDVSMQESLATQEHLIRQYANDGVIVGRHGSQHNQVAPARIFPCRDGYIYLYVSRQHWKLFLKVWTDHPGEFDSPEWENNLYRRARAEQINKEVEGFTTRYGKQELTNLLQSHGIPCTPVNSPLDFISDEQVRERGFFAQVRYPGCGALYQPGAPFLIGGSRPQVRAAPAPGEHQAEVFTARRNSEAGRMPTACPADEPAHSLPLSGMRIVSFDHVLAGPYGTTLLAELGADVIKVESRHGGLDPFRFFGTGQDPNLSPRFLEFNRNKRSLAVNLKKPDGPEIIKDLVRHSDAVLDNFSVDVMSRLGLAYDDLCRMKPDIIALRMPGLGCTGPKRSYSTVGTNITAFTGLTYLWNHPGHATPPVGSQTVYPDYVSGVFAAILVVAAVLHRDRRQRGAFIDLSQAEAAAYMIGASLIEACALGRDADPFGNSSFSAAPHGCYRCKGEERWCVIAVETEEQWGAMVKLLGPEIERDRRFEGFESRAGHREELDALIERWTKERDPYEVLDVLQRLGIPCGVVQNGADLAADPHLKDRGFLVEVHNQRLGRVILPGFPLRFANCALKPRWVFPELGRDNEEVLCGILGYGEARVLGLVKEGVLE